MSLDLDQVIMRTSLKAVHARYILLSNSMAIVTFVVHTNPFDPTPKIGCDVESGLRQQMIMN